MKIDNEVPRALRANDTAPNAKATGSAARANGPAEPAAAIGSVNISETSRALQAGGTSNADAPFDVKRVEAIKEAIASGQFKVNPEAIADKVIDSASQLLVGQS